MANLKDYLECEIDQTCLQIKNLATLLVPLILGSERDGELTDFDLGVNKELLMQRGKLLFLLQIYGEFVYKKGFCYGEEFPFYGGDFEGFVELIQNS